MIGDTYFPDLDWQQWTCLEDSRHAANEKNPLAHSFRVYERKGEGNVEM